jgi:hypothetical protein
MNSGLRKFYEEAKFYHWMGLIAIIQFIAAIPAGFLTGKLIVTAGLFMNACLYLTLAVATKGEGNSDE